jgi:hypothetical protein
MEQFRKPKNPLFRLGTRNEDGFLELKEEIAERMIICLSERSHSQHRSLTREGGRKVEGKERLAQHILQRLPPRSFAYHILQ